MRWFKHLTSTHDNEVMAELMEEFGAEGYGVWWIIAEKIAALMQKDDRCFARYSLKLWSSFAKVSPNKFRNIIRFFQEKEIFFLEFDKSYLTIKCPKLLKYRDEYSKKKEKHHEECPEFVRSLSGQTPDQDTEAEVETNKKKKNKKKEKFDYLVSDPMPHEQMEMKDIIQSAKEVLDFMNKLTCRKYRAVDVNNKPTSFLETIMKRIKSGVSVQDCKSVIAKKFLDWKGTEREKSVRPLTIFRKSNFEQYLGELVEES